MSWRDQLVDASFRGVPFFVDRSTLQFGRRTVVHEFPGRTTPLVEDLGRAPRRWQLEMIVLGEGYLAARDALRQALERPGLGDLVLPTMGTVRAVAEGVSSLAESTSDGGVCRITVSFVEATSQLRVASMEFPALDLSEACKAVQAQASIAVASDIEAARAEAESAASMSSQSPIVAIAEQTRADAGIAEQVRACAATLRDVQRKVGAAGARAAQLASEAAALAKVPADLVSEIFATAGDLVDAALSVGHVVGSLARGLDLGWRLRDLLRGATVSLERARLGAPGDTPAQVLASRVASSVTRATAAALAVSVAQAAVDVEFRAATSAAELADALCDLIDLSLADVPMTPAAETLRTDLRVLRSAAVRHLHSVIDELPRIGRYTPQATLPDLVIAQLLYGDAARHEEIRRLNDLQNPLFCAAGVALEVLSGE